MTISRRVGIAAAIVSSAIAGSALPGVAHSDAAVLYVDNSSSARCSDAGTGTQAQPYCTVQAAADAARPGQTVQIAQFGTYQEQVVVKHSGAQGNPITFKGVVFQNEPSVVVGLDRGDANAQNAPHGFVLDGVHDVVVTGLYFETLQEAVLVKDSDRITVDGNMTGSAGSPGATGGPSTPAIRLTGHTTATSVTRNVLDGSGAAGIAVDAGVSGAVVSTNQLSAGRGDGIVVTDAPGTVVTSNTVLQSCGSGIVLAGDSAGSTIKNNILTGDGRCKSATPAPELAVSTGSTANTKADYNVVHPAAGHAGYTWGGTSYDTPAAFQATGQGSQDTAIDPKLVWYGSVAVPAALAGSTDAADARAEGELETDLRGNPRTDQPQVANTGTGNGYYDRGATEIQDPIAVTAAVSTNSADGHPLQATVRGSLNPGWSMASAVLDFGDGSAPMTTVPTGDFTLNHDYAAAGTYTVTLTATSSAGLTRKATASVTLSPVSDLTPSFSANQTDRTVPRMTFTDSTSSAWPVLKYTFDFGDGSPAVVSTGTRPTNLVHDFPSSGLFTVTETVLDNHGRSASRSEVTSVGGPVPGVPVIGYFGGPTSQVAVFNRGTWAVSYQKVTGRAAIYWNFGAAGDLPVVGRWDRNGGAQLGVYRPSTSSFVLQLANGSSVEVPFGQPGDIPVPGAWDHNGHDQLAVYRPGTRTLLVRHDDVSVTTLTFGDPGDVPLVGDWDGVGHAQFGIFRPGRNAGDTNTFALRHDNGSVSTATYGTKGDTPVVGDWLGKGRTTYGIYRASSGTFALCNAYGGQADSVFQVLSQYN
ncbi:PKD domain-containing protein [Kitasatospora sp. NPDC094015]|uniref:PKD domain-containing protein n=1 Tax=Kitasatospora sp. NPDC094015 TaxID=3155205 RepID=UPI003327F20B